MANLYRDEFGSVLKVEKYEKKKKKIIGVYCRVKRVLASETLNVPISPEPFNMSGSNIGLQFRKSLYTWVTDRLDMNL